MPEPLIQIEGAAFSHGNTPVFSSVDLAIHKGQILCLLGPNGCGKTTFLDCLLGINPLGEGEIRIDGHPISGLSPSKRARCLAYVPQHHPRSFSFSVMDVLVMGRAPYTSFFSSPRSADREMAEAMLERLGMIDFKDRDYTRLSGGETQLVMIIRALIQQTPVIVMDEPTAHLDFKNELVVLETIARMIKETALTLVMATHSPNHAFFFENAGVPVKVAFMHDRDIQIYGSPSKALTGENIGRVFGVEAAVVSKAVLGKGSIRQLVPIQTMEKKR